MKREVRYLGKNQQGDHTVYVTSIRSMLNPAVLFGFHRYTVSTAYISYGHDKFVDFDGEYAPPVIHASIIARLEALGVL